MKLATVVACIVTIGWPSLGFAYASELATQVVRLQWQRDAGAESCAEQPRVEQLVKARLGRDPFTVDAPRIIEASVTSESGSWHVELHIRDNSGAQLGQRIFDVRAESCEQVVDAVGLAVALAIDPNANLKGEQPPPSELEQPGETEDANAHPKKPGETPAPKVVPPLYPYAQLIAPIEPACPVPSQWKTRFSLKGVLATGLLPNWTPGVAVNAALSRGHSHAVLGLSYFAEAALDPRFAFGLTTVDVGYCHDLVRTRSLDFELCADGHVGSEHVVVKEFVPVNPGDQLFAAGGLGGTLGWVAWAPFYLEAGVSAWLPFVRPSFYFADQTAPIFESHIPSGLLSLGAGFMTN